jgi:2-octaprenylphenol hydroxylase
VFPLGHGHVDCYVQQGLALIGDAAHNIHPLAGQGANLGIMDAACLAQVITDALQAQRQWSAVHTLRKYERRRKGDNRLMEAAMTGFKHLFGNADPLLTEIRNIGLNAADHAGPIKQMLINQALGEH